MNDYLFVIRLNENPEQKLGQPMKIGSKETTCQEFAQSFTDLVTLKQVLLGSHLAFFNGNKSGVFTHEPLADTEGIEFLYSQYITNEGILGIVRFPDRYDNLAINKTVFDKIRDFVGCMNSLVFRDVDVTQDVEELLYPDRPSATWARIAVTDLIKGFEPVGNPESDIDSNPYLVKNLQGGIGGKH